MSSLGERPGALAVLACALLTAAAWSSASLAGPAAPGPGHLAGAPVTQATTTSTADTPAARYVGIGRSATVAEIAAWDIDVRPDFKGLPRGQGRVRDGQLLWEAQCASCHGVFGEDNRFFAPLVGGTTADDVRQGRVARLDDASYPGRTMMMKLATLSTLWDYIRRAMPWTAPKSLGIDEVYAVTAYLLHLGGVLPEDFTLSDRNMAEVQGRLPNRNGLVQRHAMWPGADLSSSIMDRRHEPAAAALAALARTPAPVRASPDVRASACMRDCSGPARISSALPDHARNQHGNLALQQRTVGPQRGVDTAGGALPGDVAGVHRAAPSTVPGLSAAASPSALALAQKNGCTACHSPDASRLVGPGFGEIASRYAARPDPEATIAGRIRAGGEGRWGGIPMPAQALPEAEAGQIARWLLAGARQ